MLLVTHDLDEALYLAERIVLIEEGRIVANLPAERVSLLDSTGGAGVCAGVHRGAEALREARRAASLQQHWDEITTLTLEHLWLTGVGDAVRDGDWSAAGDTAGAEARGWRGRCSAW